MTTAYETYRNQVNLLNEQIDAWYTIASQKFSYRDKVGQENAYAEIDKLQAKKDTLVNPMEAEDRILEANEVLF